MASQIPILGVDFSGAKADKNTWVSQGVLDGGVLTLEYCEPTRRAELADLLASSPSDAVAALDFPFSVPEVFAARWLPGARSMPDLWEAASTMEIEEFICLRDEFVAEHGEPFRRGDLYFPECYSCLHKANPNMVPMTFRGMQMLHGLWRAGCRVPPLPEQGRIGPVLLESMPGAALNAFKLPYKGYKKGRHSTELRLKILDGLESRSGIKVTNLASFRDRCIGSDDCLDSVVAAVTACLWVRDQDLFRLPQDGPGDATHRGGVTNRPDPGGNELAIACLEGWLYAPVFLGEATQLPGQGS